MKLLRKGISSSEEFVQMNFALMADIAEGKMSPGAANAINGAGRNVLKHLDQQLKLGRPSKPGTGMRLLA